MKNLANTASKYIILKQKTRKSKTFIIKWTVLTLKLGLDKQLFQKDLQYYSNALRLFLESRSRV